MELSLGSACFGGRTSSKATATDRAWQGFGAGRGKNIRFSLSGQSTSVETSILESPPFRKLVVLTLRGKNTKYYGVASSGYICGRASSTGPRPLRRPRVSNAKMDMSQNSRTKWKKYIDLTAVLSTILSIDLPWEVDRYLALQ